MVELVVAVLLGAMIMLSFAAIYANSYKFYRSAVQGNMRQSGMLMAVLTMSRDLEKTTYLFRPDRPCGGGTCASVNPSVGDVLEGCTNYDPVVNPGGTMSPDVANYPMRIFNYCVDAAGVLWYTFLDSPAPATCLSPPSVTCGTAIAGGTVMRLADNVVRSPFRSGTCTPDAAQRFFCRPNFTNNVVEMNFVVSGSTVSTSVAMSMPVLWPSP